MKKLTQAEITTLGAYNQVFENIIREFGTVAILQKDLTARKENAEKALDENRAGQQDFFKSLEEKYGAGQLDLERGIFIPAENKPVEEPAEEVDEEIVKEEEES